MIKISSKFHFNLNSKKEFFKLKLNNWNLHNDMLILFQSTSEVHAYFPRGRWYDYSMVSANIFCEEPDRSLQAREVARAFFGLPGT